MVDIATLQRLPLPPLPCEVHFLVAVIPVNLLLYIATIRFPQTMPRLTHQRVRHSFCLTLSIHQTNQTHR